jgi:hypothetical protein
MQNHIAIMYVGTNQTQNEVQNKIASKITNLYGAAIPLDFASWQQVFRLQLRHHPSSGP